MTETSTYNIRPAARIIDTLGKGLIKDDLAAIIELVKNSYDADSKSVFVKFEYASEKKELIIVVSDSGHGMDYKTIVEKWLVPGTSDKLVRKTSPGGRRMQGRKGIGRYAAGILGQELFLSTVDETHNKTELLMDWEDITRHKYLDEVDLVLDRTKSKEESGTYIEIRNRVDEKAVMELWPDSKISKLDTELSKLLSPLRNKSRDKFSICLEFGNFPSENWSHTSIEVEALPLLDLFDYRVFGSVSKTGKVSLTYQNNCYKPIKEEKHSFLIPSAAFDKDVQDIFCGKIDFDLRIFDRDPEAIEEIVNRVNSGGHQKMNKTEVKQWLNEYNGVGVYRGGFRVRPYGDVDYDWLNLGTRRVDIPAKRIGSNQIIGLVNIDTEENSGLEEKSARDGLIDNPSYRRLKSEILKLIEFAERKRYDYRVSTGRGRKLVNIEEALESLFDFDSVVDEVKIKLKRLKVDDQAVSEVSKLIYDAKEDKSKQLEDIKETIAFYRGQANLGKMVGHILHEGRKPVSYLRNGLSELQDDIKILVNKPDGEKVLNRLSREAPHLTEEVEKIHVLFSTLDPFTYKKGEKSKKHKLRELINSSVKVFKHSMSASNIKLAVDIDKDAYVYSRGTDSYWIFTNIIENSIYWLNYKAGSDKCISISSKFVDDYEVIRIYDNGPGISGEMIDNGKIFEPGISAKDGGTGMGLATVGELVRRGNGEVWVKEEDVGVSFFIKLPKEGKGK